MFIHPARSYVGSAAFALSGVGLIAGLVMLPLALWEWSAAAALMQRNPNPGGPV